MQRILLAPGLALALCAMAGQAAADPIDVWFVNRSPAPLTASVGDGVCMNISPPTTVTVAPGGGGGFSMGSQNGGGCLVAHSTFTVTLELALPGAPVAVTQVNVTKPFSSTPLELSIKPVVGDLNMAQRASVGMATFFVCGPGPCVAE